MPREPAINLPKMRVQNLIALEVRCSPLEPTCHSASSRLCREPGAGQGEVDGSWQSHREGKHFYHLIRSLSEKQALFHLELVKGNEK